ncbi:hypothetical protein K402DRAFT_420189 [Aulographum hederae CBS 113979]|uniref:DUF7580 domain-containing protein n=1 Tax=Aulographum hederae CBS 113979 TaxID=1176131 RepID=A0A6G1H2Y8_9PEZI|nr:hypothetical protein K402DRAFT_420189 [Aulographum hederae CBS 113979]
MAEIALAAIGVVPVLVESVKAYKTLHGLIRTARRCVAELEEVGIDFQIQERRFMNEYLLLLGQLGVDDDTRKAMVKDSEHHSWNDPSLEDRIRDHLDENYDAWQKILSRIRHIQQNSTNRLLCFEQVKNNKNKRESWNLAFKRVSRQMRFSFNKEGIEEQISALRKRNEDLESLGKYVRRTRQQSSKPSNSVVREIPPSLHGAKEISNEVYGALAANLKCKDISHEQHTASLCLDANLAETKRWSMAISYVRKHESTAYEEPSVWFFIQSRAVTARAATALIVPDVTPSTREADVATRMNSASGGSTTCVVQPTSLTGHQTVVLNKSGTSALMAKIVKRKRKVTFADDGEHIKRSTNGMETELGIFNATSGPSVNLGAIDGPCQYLFQRCKHSTHADASLGSNCVAFLQHPDVSRYIFYISRVQKPLSPIPNISSLGMDPMAQRHTISLQDYIRKETRPTVSIVYQFKLALKLALAVLRYHSTPWLPEEFGIAQLELMPSTEDSPENFSLYLKSRLIAPSTFCASASSSSSSASTPGVASCPVSASLSSYNTPASTSPPTFLSAARRRGVYNTSLFCLGMALLEIGHWKRITELQEAIDDDGNYDIVDVARVFAGRTAGLGKAYDDIIDSCIRCNFPGMITDLGSKELQSAVWNKIVCPLDELVRKLEGLNLQA